MNAEDPNAPGGWVSASDVGEFVYCPRAHYYRGHPPAGGEARESAERARRGTEYHRSRARGVLRREGSLPLALLLLGVALGLLGLAYLLAGLGP